MDQEMKDHYRYKEIKKLLDSLRYDTEDGMDTNKNEIFELECELLSILERNNWKED